MSERTYSEREAAAIIARAAERQRLAPLHDDGTGLTLREIERAGREAGLDAEALRVAAAEFDARLLAERPERTSVAERWLDEPLQPEAWEDAVAALRILFGPTATLGWTAPPSDTTQVGTGYEWAHTDFAGLQTTVFVSPRGDRTRIRVVQVDNGFDINSRGQAVLFAGFIGLIPAMLLGALLAETLGMGDLVGVAAVLVVLAVSVGPGGALMNRQADRNRARRRARQSEAVQDLADELAHRIEAGAVGPGLSAGGEANAGEGETLAPSDSLIDPSILDAQAESPAAGRWPDRRTRA